MENTALPNESGIKWNINNRNKLRLLYLLRYLMENTDSEHPLSTMELTEILQNEYDINVSRNTISTDLTMLQAAGLRVDHYRSAANQWYYRGIAFDVPELKILIDALLSSKFITQQKSEEMIEKLLTQTTKNKAGQLYRHVCPNERVKSDNENGYSILDTINEAIERQQKISFYYTVYNSYKQPYVVNDGFAYVVSPYALIWDGDYYYVRGYCDDRQAMHNFRVDRILRKPMILQQAAVPAPEEFSPAEYRRTVFRMFDTDEPVEVDLYCHKSVMKYLIDCFGRDVQITSMQEEEPAEPEDEYNGAVEPADEEDAPEEPVPEAEAGSTAEEEPAEESALEREEWPADEEDIAEMSEPGTENESAGEAELTEEAVSAVNEEQPDWPEVDKNFDDVFKRKTELAPEFFTAQVKVCTSPTFFRWVFGFGGKIRIAGPENVVNQYRNMLQQSLSEYTTCTE